MKSLNLTEERSLVILLALIELKGVSPKRDVLNHIQNNIYYWLDEKEKKLTRKSNLPRWDVNLSWLRHKLIQGGFMTNPQWGIWAITEKGKNYFRELSERVLMQDGQEYLTIEARQAIKASLKKI